MPRAHAGGVPQLFLLLGNQIVQRNHRRDVCAELVVQLRHYEGRRLEADFKILEHFVNLKYTSFKYIGKPLCVSRSYVYYRTFSETCDKHRRYDKKWSQILIMKTRFWCLDKNKTTLWEKICPQKAQISSLFSRYVTIAVFEEKKLCTCNIDNFFCWWVSRKARFLHFSIRVNFSFSCKYIFDCNVFIFRNFSISDEN